MSAVLVSERVAIEAVEESVVGSQVVLDLYECAAAQLDDLEWVRETMVEAARRAKATIVETCFHKFSPWGISGVVVISESHIAVHIWPERRYVAIDVFTCGCTLGLDQAADFLARAFQSKRTKRHDFSRGGDA